ncbi:MAG: Do family serine endopeptidase [Bdellovibrionota bacterium]|nr:MAG: Do family serine endopeptidase [Bdellovibrionota bacterium]
MNNVFFRGVACLVLLCVPVALRAETQVASIGDAGTTALPNFKQLVQRVGSAVVNISVEASSTEPLPGEEALPEFLRRDPQRPFMSMGSGFIIDASGLIVTNNHVVEKSSKIIVRMLDDRTDYEASVLGRDPKTDLALIKIQAAKPLPTLAFGDSDAVAVGDWVLAIGNQFQLGQSVTAGIVSAKGRKLHSRESSAYDSFIQTDASINPGSSGGPLLNTEGQVIGVNTAIFSPGRAAPQGGIGFNIGIGFAIPANLTRSIIGQLREKGKVTRSYLGVIIQPIDSDAAAALGLEKAEGALVADVLPESPAAKAGFERRDVIVSYEGTRIVEHDDLPILVAETAVGTKVSINILRRGKAHTLTPTVLELIPQNLSIPADQPQPNAVGLVVEPFTDAQGKAGVRVEAVEPRSPAAMAGFMAGDTIEEMGEKRIEDLSSFESVVKGLVPKRPVLVLVRRKEGTRFLTLKVEK